MYTITLADGRTLTGLDRNGDNFISVEQVDESIFADNLSSMTISDGETETVMHDVELIVQQKYDDGYYLCFRELSTQEKALAALKKAIDSNANSVTDVQIALTEVYELIAGGM